jgi:CubicO group peptidase (beta-lactamase class C family)
LTFQPGEGWQYGVNIDFAGLALERLTGLSLNDYCHKNIFEPLGLKNITFFPTADMKKKLAFMHQRKPDGTLIARDHLLRKPLVVESSGVKDVLNSGGAGAFSSPSDYAREFVGNKDQSLITKKAQKSSLRYSTMALLPLQGSKY